MSCRTSQRDNQVSTIENLMVDAMISSINLTTKLSNTLLPSDIYFQDVTSKSKISLEKLAYKNLNILQYSELNCEICVDSAMRHFRNFADKVGESNCAIIVASENFRYLVNFIKLHHLQSFRVLLVNTNDFNRMYNISINAPFFFTLNANLIISDIFIPFKEYPLLTQAYFKALQEKYNYGKNEI